MIPFQEANVLEQQLYEIAARDGVPLHVSMELTPCCNMDCSMCFVRLSKKEQKEQGALLTMDQWIDIAQQLKANGTLFLLLTGGEPLLYPCFKELYLKLRALGFIIMLNTNATLIDEKWADFFAQNPPRRINITLYGASNEDYESVCRHADGFDRAVQGIRLLKKKGLQVKVSGSLIKTNLRSLESYLSLCEELEVPAMTETYMMPATRERQSPFDYALRLTPEEYAKAKLRLLSTIVAPENVKEEVTQMLEGIEQNRSHQGDNQGFKCKAGLCSFSINWQGMMRPCVLLKRPEVNVLDKGVLSAWKDIREACSIVQCDPKCRNCEYRSLCPRCPAAEQAETGEFGKAPDYLCECTKEYAKTLRQYLMQKSIDERH